MLIDENLRNRARAASSHRRRTRKEEWLHQAREASETNANATREDPLPDQPWSYSPTRLVSKAKVFSTPANQASFDHFKDRSDADEGYVWTAGGKCGSKGGVLAAAPSKWDGPAPEVAGRVPEGFVGFSKGGPRRAQGPRPGAAVVVRPDRRGAEAPPEGRGLVLRLSFGASVLMPLASRKISFFLFDSVASSAAAIIAPCKKA